MNVPIDISGLRLETPRLILRPWRQTDLDDLYHYAKVDGVGEMAGWAHHRSIEESRRILELFIREKKTFAMELRESGTVIGSVGVETYDERVLNEPDLGGREIGYAMGMEHWGKGLMTEAVRAVIECCFQRLDCDFLVCGHFAANNRSRRVIEKCGFCFVKENTYTTQIGAAERELLYIQYRPNLQK